MSGADDRVAEALAEPLARRPLGKTGLTITELGLGAATLGNLYRPLEDGAAQATVRAAMDAGINYVDTAPYYGFGLSERRVGAGLGMRGDVVVSTKVGRILEADPDVVDDRERFGFRSALPYKPVFDYGYRGVMRSFEESLDRLGRGRIDILYVHDIGRKTHGAESGRYWNQLVAGGGLDALQELRRTGVIRGFGVGVNEVDICLDVMQEARLDAILLAGRYTLLEQGALDRLLPACEKSSTSVVVGGPYNSGILATGTRNSDIVYYDYAPATPSIVSKVAALETLVDKYGISLAAAALQFPLAHPQVASVIPGLDSPLKIDETIALHRTPIPEGFWAELKVSGLLRQDAPVPAS